MKKFLMGILVLSVLTLAACGEAKTDGKGAGSYGKVYAQAVENGEEATVYSLIFLDDNDIPELVACDRGNDSFSIYTVKDGSIFCMMDSVTAVELTYFERTGILAQFARWNGGGDEGGYGQSYYQVSADKTLTQEDLPILRYSYNAVYDGEGVYTGEGITEYYCMEQGTDEAAYREKLEGFGVVEGSDRLCLENAFGKGEMLERLGQ